MERKPLLKQFAELTGQDFSRHPVWVSCHVIDYDEPWYDRTDEETFRPWTGALPVDPALTMFLVRAVLTLADGRAFPGFLTPQQEVEPFDLGIIQPHIWLPSGRKIGFWGGMFQQGDKERRAFYAELGKGPKSIFPISFSAEPSLAKGLVAGSILGFCWQPRDEVEVYF